MRRFVFLLSSLLVWLAIFHTVASIESKILLQKSWLENCSSPLLASEQKLPDCCTGEASGLSACFGLSQTTHNEVSDVQQPAGKGWAVVHPSNGQQEPAGNILCIAAPKIDVIQRLPGT